MLSTVERIACLRDYRGALSYLPEGATGAGNGQDASALVAVEPGGLVAEAEDGGSMAEATAATAATATAAAAAADATAAGADDTPSAFFQPQGSGVLPPLDAPLPAADGWVRLEGAFSTVLVCNMSHIAEDTHAAPGAKLDDGLFHILVVRDIGRCPLLCGFLQLEDGTHVEREDMNIIKTRAYRLEPALGSPGFCAVDGEVVPTVATQAEIFPKVTCFFG